MAGIGFKIQKVLDEDSYTSALKGYLFGAFVASGPLIIVAGCIGVLNLLSFARLSLADFQIFRVSLVYVYALSLILTGIMQMPATRFVADALYKEEYDRIVPGLVSLLFTTTLLSVLAGGLFFSLADLGLMFLFRAVVLLALVSNVWVVMIFITAARHFLAVTVAFAAGGAAALAGGHILGLRAGLPGYLDGFAIGQAVILAALLAVVFRSFPCRHPFDFGILAYAARFPDLALIGFLINLGLWADKIVLWHSRYGETTAGFFRTFNLYDSANFLSYLTVIPALTFFFIRVETDFYLAYRKFYRLVLKQASLLEIEEAHSGLIAALGRGVTRVFWLQVMVTAYCIVCSTPLMKLLKMSPEQWGLFRINLAGAMLLLFVQLLITILLYFEFRPAAMVTVTVFCAGNFLLTLATVHFGFAWLGYGFAGSALLALLAGFFLADRALTRLTYLTFTSQPIPKPA